jgi:protein-tyrosine-phosphatase
MLKDSVASKKKVLFLCVENSCRSQIAEAFATNTCNEYFEAYSSGSKPSGVVNPKAIASMARAGVDMSSHTSKSIRELPTREFDLTVTMGCGDFCPEVTSKAMVDWGIPDPKFLEESEFDQIRDLIAEKVESLKQVV